jgi:hypothetical protein
MPPALLLMKDTTEEQERSCAAEVQRYATSDGMYRQCANLNDVKDVALCFF